MRAELLEKKEKAEREIRRLGRKALKERRYQEWLEELQASGIGEKLLDSLTADQLESMGKTHAKQAKKEQRRADDFFILARAKRRKEITDGKRISTQARTGKDT